MQRFVIFSPSELSIMVLNRMIMSRVNKLSTVVSIIIQKLPSSTFSKANSQGIIIIVYKSKSTINTSHIRIIIESG